MSIKRQIANRQPQSSAVLARDVPFSDRLRTLMVGRSIRQLAASAGLSQTGVRAYLTGTSEPGLSALVQLANVLGVSVQWLATGEEFDDGSTAIGYLISKLLQLHAATALDVARRKRRR
jgi:transcriptional regulator with XRE-family HTH domain